MNKTRLVMSNVFVILLLTLFNPKETVQRPVSEETQESEPETIIVSKGDDVIIACAVDWDPTQTKIWYKVCYKKINCIIE